MTYADTNRAKNRWGAGVVFGEMCETESKLWLARNKTEDEVGATPEILFKKPTGADGWQTITKVNNPIVFPPGC